MAHGIEKGGGFRRPLLRALACTGTVAVGLAVAQSGAAQQAALHDLPWGTSPTATVASLQQRGLRLDSMSLTGFRFAEFSAGSARVIAGFGQSGLIMLNQMHPLPQALAGARFQELRDSLARVLGAPDSTGARPLWIRPDGEVRLFIRADSNGPGARVIVNRSSPNAVAELRASYREVIRETEADPTRWIEARLDTMRWHILVPGDSMVFTVDKTGAEKRPRDSWRVRTRRDFRVPVVERGRRPYDTIAQMMEISCGDGTFRLGEGITVLAERNPQVIRSGWSAPARPAAGSVEEAIVTSFCEYARGLP
jgi:hypothetical protein